MSHLVAKLSVTVLESVGLFSWHHWLHSFDIISILFQRRCLHGQSGWILTQLQHKANLVTPWPLYLSLLVAFQHYYRHTSRELKRLSSITLSPLYAHFSESIMGLSTIRAFRQTDMWVQQPEHEPLCLCWRYINYPYFVSQYVESSGPCRSLQLQNLNSAGEANILD